MKHGTGRRVALTARREGKHMRCTGNVGGGGHRPVEIVGERRRRTCYTALRYGTALQAVTAAWRSTGA
jgi:hypothetical protein